MSRDVRLYLADITEAIGFIRSFTAGMTYAEFVSDIKTQHACIRDLQVIGEAVKKLPDTLRATYRDVPWRRISGLRDVLAHEYFGVDLKIIWDVIANRLGEFHQVDISGEMLWLAQRWLIDRVSCVSRSRGTRPGEGNNAVNKCAVSLAAECSLVSNLVS